MNDVHFRTVTSPVEAPASASVNSVDIDETRFLLNRFYYPVAVGVPEGAEGFSFRADVIQLGPLTVGQLGYGGTTITTIASELDAYHLSIPTSGKLYAHHAGHKAVILPGRAAVFGPGGPVYVLHERDSVELDVKIERSALEAELATMLGHRVHGPLGLPPVIDMSRGPLRSWARLVALLRGEITHPGSLLSQPIIAGQLRQGVLSGLLLSVPHRYTDELNAPAQAGPPRAIQRAIDAINDEPERPFTVADLAAIAGVSVRSLQEGFRRYVDSAPMTYLQQVRLSRAHDALLREDPARATVASIAHRWGFAHLGRFASAYRVRFGVCPSDTLRGNS
ncbi:AraC family transcriptional regulator [Winogradskya humida]|uniref:AraC family transcriptional regulator n=1 Tax=Winogradskya humida TaxID=113566 RepID=UPI00194129A7|nr:AraC family transcriptional regulator [Actinoplanes humidus]